MLRSEARGDDALIMLPMAQQFGLAGGQVEGGTADRVRVQLSIMVLA